MLSVGSSVWGHSVHSFNTRVAPFMDYCAVVWGYYHSDVINNTQNGVMCYFLGVNKFTQTHPLYGELGWVMPKCKCWISFV